MISQSLHSWYQISSIWHHIHSLGHHTTLCMTSSPLDLTSRPPYVCHHNQPIDDITATIWMVSHPVYMWHHIPNIYDIMSTMYDIRILCVDDTTLGICVTYFPLQMTSHTVYHPKPQYLWCHIHFRHDITLPVSDIAPTVSLSSQPLLISHPLLNDITPTFCVTSYALYITSHPILLSSHYSTYDITASIYENTSSM